MKPSDPTDGSVVRDPRRCVSSDGRYICGMVPATAPNVMRVAFRWSDVDANLHVRHSVYYDLGAQQRVEVLAAAGLTMAAMRDGGIGPVLFREEARFLREIRPNDAIEMVATVTALGRDHRKFSIRHDFMRGDERCAVVQVDGAWFSSTERKIIVPPQLVITAMSNFPKADDFAWIERAG